MPSHHAKKTQNRSSDYLNIIRMVSNGFPQHNGWIYINIEHDLEVTDTFLLQA